MDRIKIQPRNKWQDAVERLGFGFHTTDVPYWDESAYYSFTLTEIEKIETATNKLWEMCLQAVQYVIDNNLYEKFKIPKKYIPYIQKTWNEEVPSIYGRFDFSVKNGQIKMLELYNGFGYKILIKTKTSLTVFTKS
jgi:glutathionylspermidine synthase